MLQFHKWPQHFAFAQQAHKHEHSAVAAGVYGHLTVEASVEGCWCRYSKMEAIATQLRTQVGTVGYTGSQFELHDFHSGLSAHCL